MDKIKAMKAAGYGILAGLGSTKVDGFEPDVVVNSSVGHALVGLAVALIIYSRSTVQAVELTPVQQKPV